MVKRDQIQAVCDEIVRKFRPLKVILFGSYAYGNPTEDSDVDLFVVLPAPAEEVRDRGYEIYRTVAGRFPMDVVTRSPMEIAERVGQNDWFLKDIIEKGLVLYESPDRGMGGKGGSGL